MPLEFLSALSSGLSSFNQARGFRAQREAQQQAAQAAAQRAQNAQRAAQRAALADAFDKAPKIYAAGLAAQRRGGDTDNELKWKTDDLVWKYYGQTFSELGFDKNFALDLTRNLAQYPGMQAKLFRQLTSNEITEREAGDRLVQAGADPQAAADLLKSFSAVTTAEGRAASEMRAREVHAERNVASSLKQVAQRQFGREWTSLSEEEQDQVVGRVNRVETFGEFDSRTRASLIASGYKPNSWTPAALRLVQQLHFQQDVDRAGAVSGAQASAKRAVDARYAEFDANQTGRETLARERARAQAKGEGALTDIQRLVAPGWADDFQAKNGRRPTQVDWNQAGLISPTPELARQVALRRSGTAEVVSLVNKLTDQINTTGPGFRGPAATTARFIDNFQASVQGLVKLFTDQEPGVDVDFGGLTNELKGLDAFSSLTVQSETVRVLTTQLAYALARAEGQQGRAITATILKENYIPQAAGALNDPRTAIQRLQRLAGNAVARFNVYQQDIVGPNAPPYMPDFIPSAPLTTFDDPPPRGSTDSEELFRELQDFRERNRELFNAPSPVTN